jgi:branched-chain amino acid transport system permease protein
VSRVNWFLQQSINGLALGSIYALIALGYTMVYGVLRFINFAHSDVMMLGAFAAYFLSPPVAKMIPAQSYFGAAVVMVLSAMLCAAAGMLIEFLAYRPLRKRPKLTVLITAIGVSLFIEYTCQHDQTMPSAPLTGKNWFSRFFDYILQHDRVFGAATRSFPKQVPEHDYQWGGLSVNSSDIGVLMVTALLLAGLWWIVHRTRVGMAMRAVSFNERAASLMGVNINRIISFTFGLGSALAAVAGIFYSMRAQGIEPLMGVQPGLRAFTAAVVGGIGNLPGAALGGIVLGLLETFAGGVPILSNYRDGISFAILILILLFKPAGLLGKATVEKV